MAAAELEAGNAQKAFDIYSRAVAYDPTAKNPALIKRIANALRTGS